MINPKLLVKVEKELKEVQKTLQAEQKQWETQKSSIQRTIVRLQALIATLQAKIVSLEHTLDKTQQESDKVESELKLRTLALSNAEDSIKLATQTKSELHEEISGLQIEVTALRGKIDSGLQEHEDTQRKQLETRLGLLTNEIADLVIRKDSIETEIKVNNEHLAQIVQTVAEAQQANTDLLEQQGSQVKSLDQTIATLVEDKTRLEQDIKERNAIRLQVESNTNKTEERHKQFIEYERRARKELETQEVALQKKAEDLGQQERFLKAKRSLLPQM